jgi:hypothetical protein
MAMTLVEASKYSNDVLQKGVIELLVYDDPVLEKLPFKDIPGNGLTYDVETTMSGADFFAVGDTWVESTSVVAQHTATTTILGGDADVDNFLKATRSNVQDLMTEQIAAKTKAIKEEFKKAFYYGYRTGGGADAKAFDGLHYLIRSTTSPYVNAWAVNDSTSGTPAPACMLELEAVIDSVKNGKPDLLLMSKANRRRMNQYLNSVGGITKAEAMGRTVQTVLEIPVAVSDRISDNESCDDNSNYEDATNGPGNAAYGHDYTDGRALGTDDASSTVFVVRFGPDAVCGIQSLPVTVEKMGNLETKDAQRVRIKWYPAIMLQSIISAAKYSGISAAVWSAA